MLCVIAYLYFVGLLLNSRFGFASELRQRCDRVISAALFEEEIRRLRHRHEADEEDPRQDKTDNP